MLPTTAGRCYLWPKGSRCCNGRTYLLEAAITPPDRLFQQIHADHGTRVWATPGLIAPAELHLQLSRQGALRAFWNGQAWIG
jgi:hypothetical protein